MVKRSIKKLPLKDNSLTPKTFYKILFSSLTLLMIVMLILVVPGNDNLTGYAVALEEKISVNVAQEFIPCPLSFKNLVCYRGQNARIWFSPVFKVFSIKPNVYIRSTISLGFQPTCWYYGQQGQLYRLQGKITDGGPCRAVNNGFMCDKK
jgi:hypothetical protein